ncbi:hypothetical protein scyTo_0006090 [Scyliorhinus torazame]|uniref:Uncharacterized protein n=1 Tax=Scyliorhinus torazame TaxID=75743 RepID=A0A401PFD9_SCYTO|nr:hypothetical protein [Scyliorhinus torazame]
MQRLGPRVNVGIAGKAGICCLSLTERNNAHFAQNAISTVKKSVLARSKNPVHYSVLATGSYAIVYKKCPVYKLFQETWKISCANVSRNYNTRNTVIISS